MRTAPPPSNLPVDPADDKPMIADERGMEDKQQARLRVLQRCWATALFDRWLEDLRRESQHKDHD